MAKEGGERMIISFMILEDKEIFSNRLKQIIERRLMEELGLESKIVTASSLDEAIRKKARISIDIHVVDIDLKGRGNGLDYIKEVAQDHDGEPVIPVVVISSHKEEYYKMKTLNELKTIGYIEKGKLYDEKQVLKDLEKAVKCAQYLSNKTVVFSRLNEKMSYKEKNIWCIERLPNGQKKMSVTIYDEHKKALVVEEFSLKRSLLEIPTLFSSEKQMIRCHQSWFVNPRAIVGATKHKLILSQGVEVPLGDSYRESIELYL